MFSDRPPFVFFHGFLGNSKDFTPFYKALGLPWGCVSFDLPGHGDDSVDAFSDPLWDFNLSFSSWAYRVLIALNQGNITQCNLVGYSMGARLALYLGLFYPHRVAKMVLFSGSPGLESQTDCLARRDADQRLAASLQCMGQKEFEDFLNIWYRKPLFGELASCENFPNLYQTRRNNSPAGLAMCLRGLGTGVQPSLWPYLDCLKVPTLLVYGENDEKFKGIQHKMAQRSPLFQCQSIPEASHCVLVENFEACVQSVKKFIDSQK